MQERCVNNGDDALIKMHSLDFSRRRFLSSRCACAAPVINVNFLIRIPAGWRGEGGGETTTTSAVRRVFKNVADANGLTDVARTMAATRDRSKECK